MSAQLAAAGIKAGADILGQVIGSTIDYYKNNPAEMRNLRKTLNSDASGRIIKDLELAQRWKGARDYLVDKKKSGAKLRIGERRELARADNALSKIYKQYPDLKKNFDKGYQKIFDANKERFQELRTRLESNPKVQSFLKERGGQQGPGGNGTYERFSPEQITAQQNSLNRSENILNQNPASFAPIANEYRQQFSRNIPELMKRFGEGGIRSGSFFNALGSGAADFESKLASAQAERDLGYREHALRERALGLEPRYGSQIGGGNNGMQSSAWGDFARTAGRNAGDLASEYLKGRKSNNREEEADTIDATTPPAFKIPSLEQRIQAGMKPTTQDVANTVYGSGNQIMNNRSNQIPQTGYDAYKLTNPYSY